jgi:hypothetical protein
MKKAARRIAFVIADSILKIFSPQEKSSRG